MSAAMSDSLAHNAGCVNFVRAVASLHVLRTFSPVRSSCAAKIVRAAPGTSQQAAVRTMICVEWDHHPPTYRSPPCGCGSPGSSRFSKFGSSGWELPFGMAVPRAMSPSLGSPAERKPRPVHCRPDTFGPMPRLLDVLAVLGQAAISFAWIERLAELGGASRRWRQLFLLSVRLEQLRNILAHASNIVTARLEPIIVLAKRIARAAKSGMILTHAAVITASRS